MTLVELLLAVSIGALFMVALASAVGTGVKTQSYSREANDLNQQARFAIQRMEETVRATPSTRAVPATSANHTAAWLSPVKYCLNAGQLRKTDAGDSGCTGGSVIADSVASYSAERIIGNYMVPMVQFQLTLTGANGASVTLTSVARLGGGTQ